MRPIARTIHALGAGLDRLGQHKAGVEAVQYLVTIVALITAGVWTILLTSVYRETAPKIKIEHHPTKRALPEQKKVLLIVDVVASNEGKVMFEETGGYIAIYQLFPVEDPSVFVDKRNLAPALRGHLLDYPHNWPKIDEREIPLKGRFLEPGENEQYSFDVVLDESVKMVQIYTFIRNEARSQPTWWERLEEWSTGSKQDHSVGWEQLTTYDLEEPSKPKTNSGSVP